VSDNVEKRFEHDIYIHAIGKYSISVMEAIIEKVLKCSLLDKIRTFSSHKLAVSNFVLYRKYWLNSLRSP